MASNDGQRLTVFGLGFRQHDNRNMQQILRHYQKMPTQLDRGSLYTALAVLAREVSAEDAQTLTTWLANGGEFPFGPAPPPRSSAAVQRPLDFVEEIEPLDPLQAMAPHRRNRGLPHWQPRERPIGHHPALPPPPPLNPHGRPPPPMNPYARHDTWASRGQGRTIEDDGPAEDRNNNIRSGIEGQDTPLDENNFRETSYEEARLFEQGYGNDSNGEGDGRERQDRGDIGEVIRGLGANTLSNRPTHSGVRDEAPEDPLDFDDFDSEDDLDLGDMRHHQFAPDVAAAIRTARRRVGRIRQDVIPDAQQSKPDVQEEECSICFESYDRSEIPYEVTADCDHEVTVCMDCVNSSIAAALERGALHQVACPSCPGKLTRRDVEKWATKEVFERFEYLTERANMLGFEMCLGPGCDAGQIHEINEQPFMICNVCQFKTCVHHKLPWHEGYTCEEFDLTDEQIERLEQEEASAKMLAADTSICPKCKEGVNKQDGCDHMACRCGTAWCYVCRADWENVIRFGAGGHASFCDYHPNKVAKSKSQREADQKRMTELVHGRPVSEGLVAARENLQMRRREEMRPKLVEAAEKRLQAMQLQKQSEPGSANEEPPKKKKRVILKPAWEEGGTVKKAFGG